MTAMSKIIIHSGQKYPDPVRRLPDYPFDYRYLTWLLRNYHSPRDKISRMIKKGEIIQVKKGLYVLAPKFGGSVDNKVIANLIYGPSYVSLEYALQYWGLIPERVETVTSITCKRNKFFQTPLGNFSYQYLHKTRYFPGVLRGKIRFSGAAGDRGGESGYLIASAEKALCDKIASVREIKKISDVPDFLESDLRIDIELLNLDVQLLEKIENAYRKMPVSLFVKWFKQFQG